MVVFDVDGVLVDSRQAVYESYREAGIEMPDDAWGKPWYQWLPHVTKNPSGIHELKNAAYLRRIANLPLLSGADVAQRLVKDKSCKVAFVTGASRSATEGILRRCNLFPHKYTYWTSCDFRQKVRALRYFQSHYWGEPMVYVDDQLVGESIATQADVKFLHYDGRTADELMEELWKL